MKSTTVSVRIVAGAATVLFALTACGSKDTAAAPAATSTTVTATTKAAATSAPKSTGIKNKLAPVPAATTAGTNPTIADYITQAGLTETPIHPGDAGAPTIALAYPEGWIDAGSDTPDWAYGAIVYYGPESADYTPSMIAIVSKLEGNVDAQKIIDSASGELKNLKDFTSDSDGEVSTLSGFPAYQIAGTYTADDGSTLVSAQKTVVIPGSDGSMYVLQINVDGTPDQLDLLQTATQEVNDKTVITA